MATGTDTIDFGSTPVETATKLVTAGVSGLTSASYIEAFFMRETNGDNSADAHEFAGLFVPLVCEFVSATSFNVIAQALMGLATGTFRMRWATV